MRVKHAFVYKFTISTKEKWVTQKKSWYLNYNI